MKSIILVALAAFASGVAGLTINTPSDVSECIPTLLTWSGGTGPYYLSIEPGNDPSGAPLQQYGPLEGTSFTWPTNITSSQQVSLTIKDSTGATNQCAPFNINAGSSSCIGASASASSGASSASSSASGASSSAAATTAASGSSAAASSTAPASSASAYVLSCSQL
ncbi:hypothetical protein IEO21_03958 [Rhodonia placenta]|uniref:Uncharacterized protein n=1 Tax=Rhodonia placenta TaxID=104341 RepID=A0A8H7U3P1_9APHY|nr:hypothetical protein IEO21_03958 [Postia placenta]